MATVYDFKLTDKKGNEVSLSEYKGKVLLIVNTATGCGFTPQYEELEAMYHKYRDQGFEILDVPCNQFGQQAPGTDDEITQFCTMKYGTDFPQFKKSDVNGENELPLFTWLKSEKGFEGFGSGKMAVLLKGMLKLKDKDYAKKPDIKWNFTKFLVDREGNAVARFEPTNDLKDVEAKVESLL